MQNKVPWGATCENCYTFNCVNSVVDTDERADKKNWTGISNIRPVNSEIVCTVGL